MFKELSPIELVKRDQNMETDYKKWKFKFNEVRAGCYENVAYRVSGHQVAANGLEDACYTIFLMALKMELKITLEPTTAMLYVFSSYFKSKTEAYDLNKKTWVIEINPFPSHSTIEYLQMTDELKVKNISKGFEQTYKWNESANENTIEQIEWLIHNRKR